MGKFVIPGRKSAAGNNMAGGGEAWHTSSMARLWATMGLRLNSASHYYLWHLDVFFFFHFLSC